MAQPESKSLSHNEKQHRLLNQTEAATYSGLPPRLVRRLFETRALPLVRIGQRRVFVRAEDLDAYIAAQVIPAQNGGDQ